MGCRGRLIFELADAGLGRGLEADLIGSLDERGGSVAVGR
jgi:hypothetical protein